MRDGGIKTMFVVSVVLVALAAPAWASLTGPESVRAGKNISVFHNSDFVAVFGYMVGEQLTVDVYRGPHRIATASGPAVDTPDGAGLEVNHGPVGPPAPGDCWEDFTPDILPGDRIVVTDASGATDQVLVDGITITSGPTDDTSTADTTDVILEGRASFADGTPIPVERLDSAELRHDNPRFRATPNTIERIPGTTDGWRATYKYPYNVVQIRDALTVQERKQAILDGDHAMGYGHVAPLPAETQIAEFPAPGGPALGCEASPRQANAVTVSDDRYVNLDSGGLELGGTAAADVTAVSATLSDGDAATDDPTVDAAGLSADPGAKGWSAGFTRAQIESLRDGTLTASGAYQLSDGSTVTGGTKKVQKDTLKPAAPIATPAGGFYNTAQAVSLDPDEADATIRYTTNGSEPTATTGQLYSGQINVATSQAIKAKVFDAAGNASETATFDYTIDTVVPSVNSSPAGGTFTTAQSVSLTASEPADIYYTTNQTDPLNSTNAARTKYSGPIDIATTTTLKYAAVDRAGNTSAVATETYTISATVTAPGAPTIGTATAGNASATVNWTPPTNDGGRAITEYRVQVFNSGGTLLRNVNGISANATSAVVSNLNNGTAYKFKVQASNTPDGQANVWGPASAFSNTVTPTAGTTVTLPGAPTIGTAVSGVTTDTAISATAKWSAPTNTGGSAITGYRVTAIRFSSTGAVMSQSVKTTGASATQLKFTGLVSGGLYRFEVQASNTPAGQTKVWGPASALSNQVTAR